MTFLYPMRPGLTIPDTEAGRDMLPKDWWYQPKLDDERAMVHASGVYTRFGKPFDKVKLAKFNSALFHLAWTLGKSVDLSTVWFDVALIGFRKTRPPYRVVLLDIPCDLSYVTRMIASCILPKFETGDIVTRLTNANAETAMLHAKTLGPQCEGIIGRNPNTPYQSGDSDNMIKMRFKR